MSDPADMVSLAPDHSSRDQLIEQNLDLSKSLAWKLWTRLPGCVDVEELQADAYLGLLRAAENFDPARGVRFRTYATPRIRGQMLDGLRERNHGKRHAPPVHVESLNVEVHSDSDGPVMRVETIADDSDPVGLAMETFEEAQVILRHLKPEHRRYLVDHHAGGKTKQQIADEEGISVSAVSLRFKRIHRDLEQIRRRRERRA